MQQSVTVLQLAAVLPMRDDQEYNAGCKVAIAELIKVEKFIS
jgi:hypothetical protein